MKHALSLSLGLAAAFCSTAAQAQAPRTLEFVVQAAASDPGARAIGDLGPLMSRMQLMLGPVTPPQTGRDVVPSPAPSAPRPSAPTTEPAPTTQTEPAVEPTPAQTPPAAQPIGRPGIEFPTDELPAALMEAGYPRALAALRPRILRCYEPALRAPTPISGQVTFELRISTHGGVVGIRRLNAPALTTITEPVLSRCVESVLRGLRLPQVQSDTVTVQQAVVLRAP